MFVAFNKHQHFKSFNSQTTSIRVELSSSTAEKSCVSNFKIADYFFKLGYDVFSSVMACESSASAA